MMETKSNDLLQANGEFGIEYLKNTRPMTMAYNHYHNHYEIYYLLSGERYYFIKERTYHIMQGDLVMINPFELHRTSGTHHPRHERILINFKKEFVEEVHVEEPNLPLLFCFNMNKNLLRLDIGFQKKIEPILFQMIDESQKKLPGYSAYLKVLLIELLLNVNRYTVQHKNDYFDHPSSVHQKISGVVKYMNDHYAQHLTLPDMASRFAFSSYYLSRTFKEVTGFTFVEYLNSVRIKEAHALLRDSDLNITQISEKVGYESSTHFGRVFKAATGISPLKYRKNKSQNPPI